MVTSKSSRKRTTGIMRRRLDDGTMRYTAQFKVQPFDRVSKTFTSLDEAIRWRETQIAELRKQSDSKDVAPNLATLTIAELNTAFLAEPDVKALRYFPDLQRQLKWWSTHYGSTRVLDFGVLQLREGRAKLMPGRAPATVVRTLSAQRSAWNWGRATRLVPEDKVWPPRLMLREPRARVRFLSDDELQAVMKAARQYSLTINTAVVVALACGCRLGEMLRLTWPDVDYSRSRIRLLLTKNNESRGVHLPAIAVEALKALQAGSKVSGNTRHVFLMPDGSPMTVYGLNRHWRKIRAAAGVTNFRWHDFRHSCASFLAQNGATLLEIGTVLGHKSAQVTLKYAHLVDGDPVTGHSALNDKLLGATHHQASALHGLGADKLRPQSGRPQG